MVKTEYEVLVNECRFNFDLPFMDLKLTLHHHRQVKDLEHLREATKKKKLHTLCELWGEGQQNLVFEPQKVIIFSHL